MNGLRPYARKIYATVEINLNTTFETKLCYCRVARQSYTAEARFGFKRPVKVEFNSIN